MNTSGLNKSGLNNSNVSGGMNPTSFKTNQNLDRLSKISEKLNNNGENKIKIEPILRNKKGL